MDYLHQEISPMKSNNFKTLQTDKLSFQALSTNINSVTNQYNNNLSTLNHSNSKQSLISQQQSNLINKSEWSSRVIDKEQRELERLERMLELERSKAQEKLQKEQELMKIQEKKQALVASLLKQRESEVQHKNKERQDRQKQNEDIRNIQIQSKLQRLDQDSEVKQKQLIEDKNKKQQEREEDFKNRQQAIKLRRDQYIKDLEQKYKEKQSELDVKEHQINQKINERRQLQIQNSQQKQQELESKVKINQEKRQEQELRQKQSIQQKIDNSELKLQSILKEKQQNLEELKFKKQQKHQEIKMLLEENKKTEEQRRHEAMLKIQEQDKKIQERKAENLKDLQEIKNLEHQIEEQRKKAYSENLSFLIQSKKNSILENIAKKEQSVEKLKLQQQELQEKRRLEDMQKRFQLQQEMLKFKESQEQMKLQRIKQHDQEDMHFNMKREEEKQLKQQVLFIKENLSLKKQAIVEEIKQLRDNFRSINSSSNGNQIGSGSRNGLSLSVISEKVYSRKHQNNVEFDSLSYGGREEGHNSVVKDYSNSTKNHQSESSPVQTLNYQLKQKQKLQGKLDSLLTKNSTNKSSINELRMNDTEPTAPSHYGLTPIINQNKQKVQDSISTTKKTHSEYNNSIGTYKHQSLIGNRVQTKSTDYRKNMNSNNNQLDEIRKIIGTNSSKKSRQSDYNQVFQTYLTPKAFQQFKKRISTDRKPLNPLITLNLMNKNSHSKDKIQEESNVNISINSITAYEDHDNNQSLRNAYQKGQGDQLIQESIKSRRQSPRVSDQVYDEQQQQLTLNNMKISVEVINKQNSNNYDQSNGSSRNTQNDQNTEKVQIIQAQKQKQMKKDIDIVNVYHNQKVKQIPLKPLFKDKSIKSKQNDIKIQHHL